MRNDVRYLRRSKGFDLTQAELAREVGLTTATISAIENGANTSIEVAMRIAKFFGKDVSEVFYLSDEHESQRSAQ